MTRQWSIEGTWEGESMKTKKTPAEATGAPGQTVLLHRIATALEERVRIEKQSPRPNVELPAYARDLEANLAIANNTIAKQTAELERRDHELRGVRESMRSYQTLADMSAKLSYSVHACPPCRRRHWPEIDWLAIFSYALVAASGFVFGLAAAGIR